MKKILCEKCNFEIRYDFFESHYKICDGRGPWRKRIKGYTEESYQKFIEGSRKGGKLKNSHSNKKNRIDDKRGGFRQGGGRGKKGWYKGFGCDSSWELAYVVYCLDNSIKIDRNTKGFEYEFEGEKHKYYPDFILNDGSYLEVKGYNSKQFEAKVGQFPFKLRVLYENEMKLYISYVEEKYGKDFVVKLYGTVC